jgi:tetratricopeptide (TPR) repeat protein
MVVKRTAYTLVQAARLAGLSLATTRLLVRAGIVQASVERADDPQLTLQDVVVLQSLGAVPQPVLRAAAAHLTEPLSMQRQVLACGGRVVVSEVDGSLWDAASGQHVLALDDASHVPPLRDKPTDRAVEPPTDSEAESLAAGAALLNRGQIGRAAAFFSRASRRWPMSPLLHLQYGIALERLRRWRLARRAYERAIALDAQLEEAYRHLALMLIDRGDSQAAIRLANALRRVQRSDSARPAI